MQRKHLAAVDDLQREGLGQLGVDYPLTDLGNAEAFRDLHKGAVRYVVPRKAWLIWSDGRWRPDPNDEVRRRAKETVRLLAHQAVELEGKERQLAIKHVAISEAEPKLRALLTLAQSELPIALAGDATDRDPWLLACGNGTLDLRTGALRAHDPDDLISLGPTCRTTRTRRAPDGCGSSARSSTATRS